MLCSTLTLLTITITSRQTTALSMQQNKMWRERCALEFGLKPLASKTGALLKQKSQANEETWKRYFEYRMKVNQESTIKDEEDAEMNVDGSTEDYVDGKARILHRIQEALQDEATSVDLQPWLQHTFQSIDNLQFQNDMEIRSMTTCATIFSPYLLPHAVQLEHCHHHRPRSTWTEFYTYWHFRLVRFDGEPNGDVVQQELSKKYPKDVILLNPTYVADDEMEVLCSNGYMDPPQIIKEVDWVAVEDIDTHNFTPNTIRRIRDWLFGSQASTTEMMSDYDFLRLLFASFGTANFKSIVGDVGYFWSMSTELYQELMDEGVVDKNNPEFQQFTGLSWLQYQARLVAGALRPFDKYYVPYDSMKAKSEWGRRVLETCEDGQYSQDDNDLDLHQVPWLVWERAEKTLPTMRMAMQLMRQLRNQE